MRGKEVMVADVDKSVMDHPRVCGEKLPFPRVGLKAMGSPPRVRGKGFERRTNLVALGITPACAGKSAAARLYLLRS